ncbi:MAG: hypothetical protein KNN13_05185 [Hydrogenobacter thermophilus]|uniref:hypothetical protein n=1 Tax=Hydrogenobacter thermophilus TaxID=940 RepID=UPI000CB331CA|nr:hypothetical protein [Hydrogenobacter thermophilus]QWK18920.1 MAG: hypothetical protein KNN13_05185 [Hydrogenobacter thermophilus]GBC88454.1 hypothetical protein HRbin13_00577 [bacterium HR13]
MGELKRKLDTDYVYFAEVEMLLNYGIGYPDLIIRLREKIHQEGLEDSVYVRKTDRKLLQNVHRFIELLDGSDEPILDDESQPHEKWWWHLRSIARGKHPSLTLPSYLRDVYRKRRKYWKQRGKENLYNRSYWMEPRMYDMRI